MHLPINTFKTIIKNTPLVSIDLVVINENNEVLLGYRNNRPAKGYWFVPGGRILKNESMQTAFRRLTLNELGTDFELDSAELIGPFEHFYPDNVTDENFSTHYIALGYRLPVQQSQLRLPFDQHCDYEWMTIEDCLGNKKVHKHSRWYFDPAAQ